MFDKLIESLKKLEKAHNFYVGANEADRDRIYQACDREGGLFDGVSCTYVIKSGYPSVDRLHDSGYGSSHGSSLDRSFGTLYLLYGNEFLKAEYKVEDLEGFIALLRDGKVLY